jgi:hypothetical protein
MLASLAERIRDGVSNQKGLFDSVVGQIKTQEKRWIVDIDTQDIQELRNIQVTINRCKPEGPKTKFIIPTKNGWHLITGKFDVKTFKEMFPDIDIQKKNPTLLYLPNSLDVE